MTTNPTGEQYDISHGRYAASVTEVGGHLRSLSVDGRELLWTFAADELSVASQGKQLLPWPNRIRDGKYMLNGVAYQLPISEVPRQNALHGLNDGFAWHLISHTDNQVVQRHTFHPETGWPGTITATLEHNLSDDGLSVVVHVVNDGGVDAPYGYGVHPYFAFDHVDQVTLELPFEAELRVDAERLLPLKLVAPSRDKDFRAPRHISETALDTAYTQPASPLWTARVVGPEHTVEVWGDPSMPWVQVYTNPDRNALAVEPMTCGPDAFNEGPTHDGLVVLAPGDSHVSTWGVRAG